VMAAPAMETHMWQHPATRANVDTITRRGVMLVGPAEGNLASGGRGPGRMAEPDEILDTARALLAKSGDMAGLRVVVTAGGTREAIDPVRYLTNRSSGKMGHALAAAARDRGAAVTLITTVSLPVPAGVESVRVDSASEMKAAVLAHIPGADVLVMAAAVADFRPASRGKQKIKKTTPELTIRLERTDDILAAVGEERRQSGWPRCVVCFAAETQDVLKNAATKLSQKGLDLIAANDVSRRDAGFEVDTNQVAVISADGSVEKLPLLSKLETAHRIWDRARACL